MGHPQLFVIFIKIFPYLEVLKARKLRIWMVQIEVKFFNNGILGLRAIQIRREALSFIIEKKTYDRGKTGCRTLTFMQGVSIIIHHYMNDDRNMPYVTVVEKYFAPLKDLTTSWIDSALCPVCVQAYSNYAFLFIRQLDLFDKIITQNIAEGSGRGFVDAGIQGLKTSLEWFEQECCSNVQSI